jgi:hypothetical protein
VELRYPAPVLAGRHRSWAYRVHRRVRLLEAGPLVRALRLLEKRHAVASCMSRAWRRRNVERTGCVRRRYQDRAGGTSVGLNWYMNKDSTSGIDSFVRVRDGRNVAQNCDSRSKGKQDSSGPEDAAYQAPQLGRGSFTTNGCRKHRKQHGEVLSASGSLLRDFLAAM